MPFARATPPTANLAGSVWPLVTNSTGVQRPAAPHTPWLYAQIFTHPERIDDLIADLPTLLATLAHGPAYWFARYRSVRETDHLRLRIATNSADEYAAAAQAIGAWGQRLCQAGALSRWTLASYYPEVGRYGAGAAMRAAETVFAADSHAVVLAHQLLRRQSIDPVALTAIGLVDIVDGFHGDDHRAAVWLVEHLSAGPAVHVDRAIADQAAVWATRGTLPDGSGLPAALADAWQDRRASLARYRQTLPDGDHHRALTALLHMHHNRFRRIDRDDESTCLRLARRVALARRAHATEPV
jgi:thiopeptide-type bacteriocin biosynthesis protein